MTLIDRAELRTMAEQMLDAVVVMDDEKEGFRLIEQQLVALVRATVLTVIASVESTGHYGLAVELRGQLSKWSGLWPAG